MSGRTYRATRGHPGLQLYGVGISLVLDVSHDRAPD